MSERKLGRVGLLQLYTCEVVVSGIRKMAVDSGEVFEFQKFLKVESKVLLGA